MFPSLVPGLLAVDAGKWVGMGNVGGTRVRAVMVAAVEVEGGILKDGRALVKDDGMVVAGRVIEA